MPARSKRSLAQLGKHGAKKLKVHHPDEAPAPATKRCRYARLAGASRRRRAAALGARPDLYESVCALSPTELMYHLYEMPAELANLTLPVVHTADEYSAAERKEMDAMSERHELLFPDDGSEL